MAHKPQVLVLTPDFPPAPGGIQLLVHRLAATMSRLEPLAVAPNRDGAAEFDAGSAVPVHRVNEVALDHRATIARLNAASLAVATRYRPDVVLSAHIVLSPATSLIRRRLGIPVVQYLHANEVGARLRLARFALAHADATIAVSRHTCQLARSAGVRESALHRIPPGVDLPERTTRPRASRPTIITVARLEDRYKGHDTLVRALPLILAQVPETQWMVIGGGPRREQLERLAEIHGVADSARFLGQVSNDDRDGWLERAHVFAMPSRVPGGGLGGEGFGIVYMEASWRGLPVVAGNVGGAVDAVVDGETGLLIDANDPVAVADAVTKLLVDNELRLRMGERGSARAREFAWPLITRQVEDVLLAAAASR
jgi:phosphatidylinositol alpha-1,6-mannosyltransferase